MTESNSLAIRLHPADNVVVARAEVPAGTEIESEHLTCRSTIPFGHKVATAEIRAGKAVKKYGQIIGFACVDILPGDHVHTHNLCMGTFDRDYAIGTEVQPAPVEPASPLTFDGIVRTDGRVATRNYIGVISTVNCSASVARYVADAFRGDALADFPNVDGVVPLCHGTGCAVAGGTEGFDLLLNTMVGWARHPNFGGIVLIGLGCEVLQIDTVTRSLGFGPNPLFHTLTIQETGGSRKTVDEAVARVRQMLPEVNRVKREPVPAGRLILGLQCGGSDAYSGITANPALGAAVDRLVRQGGTAVLGETPEIYGAEHLLTRRAVSREVAEKLLERIRWWETYTVKNGAQMDNNPSPGNKAGGLTTILEKSLGAAAKGGTTNLVEVYHFAEPIKTKGFVFMDTPGYDPVSLTGMVAGGANIICFTTGRGSVYGCKPVPSIKLATTTSLYRRMPDDMDINCGEAVDGTATVDELGERVFRMILETASGKRSKSEINGIGDNEFVPWALGAVM